MEGRVKKERLDVLLVERGLAESRARAQWLIRQGRVLFAGRLCLQPGRRIALDAPLVVTEPLLYVGRGGLKLAHALASFAISVQGLVALDVGASTGGFCDCLLQHGAARVYAVDVGQGQLHARLQQDPRVVSLEKTDIRDLKTLPGGTLADIATVDVSFISLHLVLPAVLPLLKPRGEVVALIKPQFEAGPKARGRRGVVWQRRDRWRALREVLEYAQYLGLALIDLCSAPLSEPRGNIEYLAYFHRGGPGKSAEELIGHHLVE